MKRVAKRFATRSSSETNAIPMFQTDSAQDLASPMPPLRRGTGRTASTSAPGRRFERHLSARVRTGVPYLSTARKSSVATDTTGTDASGPSFPTTSTYIAATTAPPPSSMSTLTGVRPHSSKCPSKRSECSIVVIVVAWTIRRRCAFGPRTTSQTGRLRRTHCASCFQPLQCNISACYQYLIVAESFHLPYASNRHRVRPDNSASDTEGAEEETDGAARSDAFADASLADEPAADESGAAVEP